MLQSETPDGKSRIFICNTGKEGHFEDGEIAKRMSTSDDCSSKSRFRKYHVWRQFAGKWFSLKMTHQHNTWKVLCIWPEDHWWALPCGKTCDALLLQACLLHSPHCPSEPCFWIPDLHSQPHARHSHRHSPPINSYSACATELTLSHSRTNYPFLYFLFHIRIFTRNLQNLQEILFQSLEIWRDCSALN